MLMPAYETTFITRNELTDDQLKTLTDRIANVIKNYGGEILHSEDWGKRKLAYPIKKETRGQYTFLMYTGKGDVVKEVERNLRISEHVLRFLSVTLGKEFDVTTYKAKTSKETFMLQKFEEPARDSREGGFRDRGDRGDRGGWSREDRGERSSRY